MLSKMVLMLLVVMILLPTCHGGFLGAATGYCVCTAACHAGYAACLTAGTAGAVCLTAGAAEPGVIAACTAADAACAAACIAAFTIGSGPI